MRSVFGRRAAAGFPHAGGPASGGAVIGGERNSLRSRGDLHAARAARQPRAGRDQRQHRWRVRGGGDRLQLHHGRRLAASADATAAPTTSCAPERGCLPACCSRIFEDASDAAARRWRRCLAARLCGIEFKYSLVDSGTGRELQNRPIHNIAGLGESTGERPFRPLAKPMLFMPRSTIRIEIEEISEGPMYAGAQLYIVLHGYKMLGYGTQP